jgi:transcriptional regulator with XRE-family HTH domain
MLYVLSRTITRMSALIDFGKIKERRLAMDLTMEEAAKRAKLKSRQQWSDIESGRRPNMTIETLGRVASALKLQPKDLLK